jgi:hypothetical protein
MTKKGAGNRNTVHCYIAEHPQIYIRTEFLRETPWLFVLPGGWLSEEKMQTN